MTVKKANSNLISCVEERNEIQRAISEIVLQFGYRETRGKGNDRNNRNKVESKSCQKKK